MSDAVWEVFIREKEGEQAAACGAAAGDTAAGIFEVGGRDDIITLALNRDSVK